MAITFREVRKALIREAYKARLPVAAYIVDDDGWNACMDECRKIEKLNGLCDARYYDADFCKDAVMFRGKPLLWKDRIGVEVNAHVL